MDLKWSLCGNALTGSGPGADSRFARVALDEMEGTIQ
jgi:hypothetical protein